jgi:UDP-N-acetylglucosamine transferase subunit ALG13
LSRFSSQGNIKQPEKTEPEHNTVILSGPEPQRNILKQKLICLLKETKPETIILEGNPGNETRKIKEGNLTFINHLRAPEMERMLRSSKGIISRSGYTTIMDLVSIDSSALLIPTPGQTEQEYLAVYLAEKGWFKTIVQPMLNDEIEVPSTEAKWPPVFTAQSRILLDNALKELSEQKHKNN